MRSETLSEALMSERRRSSAALLLITKQNYERCFCAATLTLNCVRLRHVRARRLGLGCVSVALRSVAMAGRPRHCTRGRTHLTALDENRKAQLQHAFVLTRGQ